MGYSLWCCKQSEATEQLTLGAKSEEAEIEKCSMLTILRPEEGCSVLTGAPCHHAVIIYQRAALSQVPWGMRGLAVSQEDNLEGESSPCMLSPFKGRIFRDMRPKGLYWEQRALLYIEQARGLSRRDWHLFLPSHPHSRRPWSGNPREPSRRLSEEHLFGKVTGALRRPTSSVFQIPAGQKRRHPAAPACK